jgi:hypothetical protein
MFSLRACHVTVGHRATLTPPRRGAVQLKPLAWSPLRASEPVSCTALRSCHLDTPFASRNTRYCATHPLTTTLDPMVHWERDVRSLLRPSEHLLLILEGAFLRHGLKGDSEASSPNFVGDASLGSSSEEPPVILAIVVHVDHAIGESGRLIINAFAPPSCAKHLPKCVPLHRGRLSIRGLSWLPSRSPTYIRNSRGILA